MSRSPVASPSPAVSSQRKAPIDRIASKDQPLAGDIRLLGCILGETVSDLREVLLLQKECGLMNGLLNEDAVADLIVVPLFATIEDLRNTAPPTATASRTSCSATPTATRTAAFSPATASCTSRRSPWSSCLTA